MICVAGIKSINILLKMGVCQTRYQTYNVRHMLCCRESIKGILPLVKPGEDEQTFCRIMHQYLCMQRVYILYEKASIVYGEKKTVVWSLAVFPFALITYRNLVPYMQKTCDVAEKTILAKKKLRKKCVNRDKM